MSITSTTNILTQSLTKVGSQLEGIQQQLATNTKTLSLTDQGIVLRLAAATDTANSNQSTVNLWQNVVTTSTAGLKQIQSLVTDMKGLATTASTDTTLSATDLTALNTQFQSMLGSLSAIVASTLYEGKTLLSSSAVAATPGTNTIQVGPLATNTITLNNVSASQATLGLAPTPALSLTTATLATTALTTLNNALSTLNVSSVNLQKYGSLLQGYSDTLTAESNAYQSSSELVSKPDQPALQVQLNLLNNQQTINYYAISQLNTEASAVLQLFR
jgi:hypothetical protein